MQWLEAIDVRLFRWINSDLANPVGDVVMPFFSGNTWFAPVLVLGAAALIWKGGRRGLLCVLLLALVVGVGDGLICNTIKHAVGRPRPFAALEGVRCLVGKSGSGSMPSAHATNWFAATMVAFICYRRSVRFMLPIALLVSLSRVYNGVHYPSDILAGAILGAGNAAAALWLMEAFWGYAGRRWFPLWWAQAPSLLAPGLANPEDDSGPTPPRVRGQAPAGFRAPHATVDEHWLRLGYVLLLAMLIGRWIYLAAGTVQLAEDEAYQWTWSKHLALSYYSKPPLIAYTQFLGTTLWGDTAFGVRFFSPVISSVIGLMLLRFFAREVNARAGFFLVLMLNAAPLTAAGALLMTVDPLSVLFWTAATLAGWRACQERGTTRDWLWVGLWMGLGFLSKYTALLQLLCWAVCFALLPTTRRHLRRPGPYLALLVNLLCTVPVLIWNYQHGWITVAHVADDAGAGKAWHPTLRFLGDFIASEAGLLNPVFFGAAVWAAIGLWRGQRRNPILVYFFSMGVPLFLVYLLQSFRTRILPNWIAPAVVPLFVLAVMYWDPKYRLGARAVKNWLMGGLALGFVLVVLSHETNLVRRVTGHYLPVRLDPLHRLRDWDTTARLVDQVRRELLTEGKPTFIIADHYGMTGQISFYLPEARAAIRGEPLVYCLAKEHPENQFYFWPNYLSRQGENAVYVVELNRADPQPVAAPPELLKQFTSVTNLGVRNVMYHDQFLLRPLQFFACRGVR